MKKVFFSLLGVVAMGSAIAIAQARAPKAATCLSHEEVKTVNATARARTNQSRRHRAREFRGRPRGASGAAARRAVPGTGQRRAAAPVANSASAGLR